MDFSECIFYVTCKKICIKEGTEQKKVSLLGQYLFQIENNIKMQNKSVIVSNSKKQVTFHEFQTLNILNSR